MTVITDAEWRERIARAGAILAAECERIDAERAAPVELPAAA